MVSTTHLEPVASTFLFLTNMLSNVKIEKLVVPEVAASDSTDTVLECGYTGAGDDVTVLWLLNGTEVYQWRWGAEPEVSGLLDGRLDLTYRDTCVEKSALRIVKLTPELSSDYTCLVRSRGVEARQTRTMTVLSPEQDFELTFSSPIDLDVINIKCTAKHLLDGPTAGFNQVPIPQHQRTWRDGMYFEATSTSVLTRAGLRPRADLGCRLHLALVDYYTPPSQPSTTSTIVSIAEAYLPRHRPSSLV